MDSRDYLIALNMIEGLSTLQVHKLLEYYKNPYDIFRASAVELARVSGAKLKIAQKITSFSSSAILFQELRLIEKHKINILTIQDNNYPSILRQVSDPPIVLYLRGKYLKADKLALAVVGSRKSSEYGLKMARSLSLALAKEGITIVSGLARGIDTQAHQGALSARGRTLAILGSGLLKIYPPENESLYNEIVESGAVISEFPLNYPPYRYNFPRRNRIISGLSLGVVVIEARQRSGSLITANMALEQGRDVFAIPHGVGFFSSLGTNELIKQGAVLVQSAQDIIDELNPEIKKYLQYTSKSGTITQGSQKTSLQLQSIEMQETLHQLISLQPRTYQELLACLGGSEDGIKDNLTALEVKGVIEQTSSGKFKKRNTGE
jgi:DNA processing protein